MTPEAYRYLLAFYFQVTYDDAYAWYLLKAFQGKARQDTFSSRPNFQEVK